MAIISGSGSFWGRFGDHFRVGDHFGVGIISGAVQLSEVNIFNRICRKARKASSDYFALILAGEVVDS